MFRLTLVHRYFNVLMLMFGSIYANFHFAQLRTRRRVTTQISQMLDPLETCHGEMNSVSVIINIISRMTLRDKAMCRYSVAYINYTLFAKC